MRRLCWDIETNGIEHTEVWCLAVADIDTGLESYFTDHDDNYPSMAEGLDYLSGATLHIGQNLIGFDIPALKQHYGWTVSDSAKIIDTMILSQLNDFYRPALAKAAKAGGKGVHAMKTWGLAMGDHKEEDPSWLEYSPEMASRCISDVKINIKIYLYLMKEAKGILATTPSYKEAIRLEHEFAMAATEQAESGWKFDAAFATDLSAKITYRMEKISEIVDPHLAPRKVWVDQKPRTVKILKSGEMDRVSREWFADKPVTNIYRRFKMVSTDLGNNQAVQDFLLASGWVPTEWNWKVDPETGRRKKASPKLTEDSFDSIKGDLGKLVSEWRTIRSRRSQLDGLVKLTRDDGRVACKSFTIGTNTFRARHRGIVNIPGVYALLGAKVRGCFTVDDDRILVSADSDSNQLRGFAHYLQNDEVSDAIVNGSNEDGTDVHSRTAEIVGVSRPIAKNVTYALLFGAQDAKLAETSGLKGGGEAIRGKLNEAFTGFEALTDKVKSEWQMNSSKYDRGFVTGLDGRRIFCDERKAFNALLQAFEAVICKEACVQSQKMIKAEGLDAKLICHYHDEYTYDVAKADAVRVGEIMEYSLGPYVTEKYNLNVEMGGTAAIGSSWAEIH